MRYLLFVMIVSAVVAPLAADAQSISAGNIIDVKLDRMVTSKSARVGETVTARLARPLRDDKEIVIPAGSRLEGRVDFVKRKSATEDGWMRLVFNRVDLPDGRSLNTIATSALQLSSPKPKRDHVLYIFGFAAIGAVLGGHEKRVAGGLGGAIVGLVFAENHHRYGRDLTLNGGATIHLRLGGDLIAAK